MRKNQNPITNVPKSEIFLNFQLGGMCVYEHWNFGNCCADIRALRQIIGL